MLILHDLEQAAALFDAPTAVAIGSFDGLHIGHQALLRDMRHFAQQRHYRSVMLTFFPHPKTVLRGIQHPFYLTPPPIKTELAKTLGLDAYVVLPFNAQLAQRTATQFIDALQAALRLRALWAGENFVLGRARQGDMAWLRAHGETVGFDVFEAQPVIWAGELVTSTRIRDALQVGDLTTANACLGRPYRLQGQVVGGFQRGRTIGFPTANLRLWDEQFLPATGVYVARATTADHTQWQAVVNIGYRPTVNHNNLPQLTIEAHLLDFAQDIYGQQLTLDLLARVRAEQRFAHFQALQQQITRDVQQARDIFEQQL